MRTPSWASSEMAPYLQSGKWNRESRAGGRGYQCVYESERVLLCRKTLVWELGSPDHLLCPRTPGALRADRGHGGSDHHNRGVSCPLCGLLAFGIDRVVCAGRGSVGGSARPPVEAQVGRHRGSTLTDFAGINGGFGHR